MTQAIDVKCKLAGTFGTVRVLIHSRYGLEKAMCLWFRMPWKGFAPKECVNSLTSDQIAHYLLTKLISEMKPAQSCTFYKPTLVTRHEGITYHRK